MDLSLIMAAVGAALVWFGARQLSHGPDRPWSHRVRGAAYATGGVGVLLGAIVFAAGWHGGLVGVLPALLVVIAFYVGGSAVRIARAVESWQAEHTRRELGLAPTPWMLPVGLIVAL
jgi:hypothetical protein